MEIINTTMSRVFRHLSDAGLSAAVVVSRETLDQQASQLKGKRKDRRRR